MVSYLWFCIQKRFHATCGIVKASNGVTLDIFRTNTTGKKGALGSMIAVSSICLAAEVPYR